MNLIDETKKKEIKLEDPTNGVHEILTAARYLHAKPEWQTSRFNGEPDKVLKLTEARGDILRAIHKIERLVGEG